MLGQAKSFASLSSTLLARKGQARPAMRPQGFAGVVAAPGQLEDLGWNDMGADAVPVPVPVPVPESVVMPLPMVEAEAAEVPVPQVLVEREALREEIEVPAAPVEPQIVRSVSVATAARLERETAHAGRAAFTLRLDAERHLKLRLASAMAHRSAQQLVSHALDQFLLTLPEVNALVAQLPPAQPKKRVRR